MADERNFKILITMDASGAVTSAKQVGKELEDAGKKGAEEFASHSQLKQGIKGLKHEFPELAHIAHMALHPVTLLTFSAAAAWKIWESRIEETTNALAGLELPQTKALEPGHINAMAEAWHEYGEKLKEAFRGLDNYEKQTERTLKNIDAALARQKELIAAQKGLNEAKDAADKALLLKNQSPADVIRNKVLTETSAHAEEKAAEDEARKKKLDALIQEGLDAEEEAQAKAERADKIHVASKEDDAHTLEEMKARAEAAAEAQKEHREWMQKIADLEGAKVSGKKPAWGDLIKYYLRHGLASFGEARGVESESIASEQMIIDAYANRRHGQPGRDALQKERGDLFGESAKDTAKAEDIFNYQVPRALSALSLDEAKDKELEAVIRLTAVLHGLADAGEEKKKLDDEIAQQIEHTGSKGPKAVQALTDILNLINELAARQKQIEQQIANLRNHP